EIAIVGRVKDTIVLSGGENIEPLPIEAALRECEYIQTAVVVGQDKKYLGALLVIEPHFVERYLKNNGIPYINRDDLCGKQEVVNLINQEVQKYVNYARGFKTFEQISKFVLLDKPFTIGRELSSKQEIKRAEINTLYKDEIATMF
ncbi:MAG: long-chain fatty acid--CoA ligase, partial [Spirochaetales bacterium]|nr:long-chain fatty acid--CoA ligase [Spirochaetales bacterium]